MTEPRAIQRPGKGAPEKSDDENQRQRPVRPQRPEFRNPIVNERQVSRFEFLYRRPPVSAQVARVFVSAPATPGIPAGQAADHRRIVRGAAPGRSTTSTPASM